METEFRDQKGNDACGPMEYMIVHNLGQPARGRASNNKLGMM
jgi:hypothetical protein